MVIYGVALLAVCLIAGQVAGEALGRLIGVPANVGGVGIAMLLLIVLTDWLRSRGRLHAVTQQGITFWSSIYIPIVVAVAASQNVAAALAGGLVALLAGGLALAACFGLLPVLSWLGAASETAGRVNSGGSGDG